MPESLRDKWDNEVVKFSLKNEDAYPDFTVFASMIEKQSLLKNHPNVKAFEKRGRRDRRKPLTSAEDHLHTVLAGETEAEDGNEKHCPFHKCAGHTLSECKAFAQKTLEEKTQWIKEERLCFRCLISGHIAKQCKSKVKCSKCCSERHPTILHKVTDGEEIKSARMSIGCNADSNVSCSKIALLDVFHPDRPLKKFRFYSIVDEQSNASMISPELTDSLGISETKQKYLLSTCSVSKETRFERRVSGLMITPVRGKPLELPTLIECDNILKDKSEIPLPEFVKQYTHLRDIADQIAQIDSNAEMQLLIGRNAPELLKVREFRNGLNGTPWLHK